MLILSRRIGEALIIGDDIEIVVLGRHRSQIKMGVTAPDNISVHREEIYQRIQEEKRLNIQPEFKKGSSSKRRLPGDHNDKANAPSCSSSQGDADKPKNPEPKIVVKKRRSRYKEDDEP